MADVKFKQLQNGEEVEVIYRGVENIEVGLSDGSGKATYYIPTGSVDIAANGTVDVSQYASAVVNVTATISNGYTVTFRNGDEVYAISAVLAGDSVSAPTSTPTSGDLDFKGWYADGSTTAQTFPFTPTADITFEAVFIDTVFENNSWAVISKVSEAGTAADYWSIGDTHSITLSGTMGTLELDETAYVFIADFDHNSAVEGKGISFAGFMSASSDGVYTTLCDSYVGSSGTDGSKWFNMNHWGKYNYGGWGASDLRYDILGGTDVAPQNYGSARTSGDVGYDATDTCATNPVANTLMSCLPDDFREVLKPMTKWTDNVGGGTGSVESNVTALKDYITLMSEYETFGDTPYANTYEAAKQTQYAYFANGASKISYKNTDTATAVGRWARSPYNNSIPDFCRPSKNGETGYVTVSYSIGVSPVFLV